MDGAVLAGGAPIGIGTPGLTLSLSFRGMGFSIARSAGVFIPRGAYIRLRSSGTDMVGGATDTYTTTITSVLTPATGDTALTTLQDVVTHTVSIADQDPQDAASIPDRVWLAQREASEDSGVEGFTEVVGSMEAGAFTEEVAAFTAEEVAAFTGVGAGFMVGDR